MAARAFTGRARRCLPRWPRHSRSRSGGRRDGASRRSVAGAASDFRERFCTLKLSLLAHALNAVGRRKARSFALGGGLAFAVALIAAVLFLTESLRAEADRARAAQPDIVVQKLVGGRPTTIAKSESDKLRDIPSVRSATPRVWGYVFLPALQGNVTIVGTAKGAPAVSTANGVLEGGRDITPGQHEMIAGVELAHFLGMLPGDELGLPSSDPRAHAMKLVGTFRSSLDLWTADVVVCDEDDARAALRARR